MSLLGLPWTWFFAGAGALAAALLLLHLLRVRLVRVPVETLLFFRAALAPQKPRVLGGKPKQWLSYALGLATLLAAWLAFADPFVARAGLSRIVIVDASGSGRALSSDGTEAVKQRLARAQELAANGLGTRGAVLAYDAAVTMLWAAGEPSLAISARAEQLPVSGTGTGLWDALLAARARAQAGDEILLLGGPDLPGAGTTDSYGVHIVRESPEAVAAAAPETPLGPPLATTKVALVGEVPRVVALAITADPALEIVGEPANAEILVVRGNAPSDRPCLRIEDGEGASEREPVLTARCPAVLSLRDRQQTATALHPRDGETVWILDARTQAPLVAASVSPRPEVRAVAWLLGAGPSETAHQDLPRLVLAGLHLLAPRRAERFVAVGEPLEIPALADELAPVTGAAQTTSAQTKSLSGWGRHELGFAEPGLHELRSASGSHSFVANIVPAAPGPVATAGNLAGAASDGRLQRWALVLALALLTLDILLYAKGRLP